MKIPGRSRNNQGRYAESTLDEALRLDGETAYKVMSSSSDDKLSAPRCRNNG